MDVVEDRIELASAQRRRRWPLGAAALVSVLILVATALLVVQAFVRVTEERFDRLEAQHGPAPQRWMRYDAFKHAYASGVVAVLLGDRIAHGAGLFVELYELDICREREKDLINNREGRRLAGDVYAEGSAGWRDRFAEALFVALREGEPFSLRRSKDPRVTEACRSD